MPNSQQKIAVVTGAAGGIGKAICRALAAARHLVYAVDVDGDAARALARDVGNDAVGREFDVASAADWQELSIHLEAQAGGLDVLVNNAAIYAPRPIAQQTADEFRKIVDVNQLGVFLGIQAAAPLMRRCGGGSIINISSTGGLRGYPGTIAYAGTKWAVRGMSKVAAIELAVDKIRVNSVHPGLCETPMAYENTPELLESLKRSIPLGRLGRPEEIADLIVFLAGPASSYITGAELVADGAATA